MEDSVLQRVKEIIKIKCKSVREFSTLIDMKPNTVNQQINGERSISLDLVSSVLNSFEDVSSEWLLRGIGSMYKTETVDVVSETRPRIPYDAAAGTLTDTVDGVSATDCEQVPVVKLFPRYDFTIRVTGRSMEPELYAGDEVACLHIGESRFLQWGRVHVLDTTQGVVIKRIYEDGESIRCSSYNKDYPDFLIPKEEVRSYNLVVGVIRL